MSEFYNVNAIYNDSNLRVTMERYSYNLWALITIIAIIVILRIIDKNYLYNMIVIIIIVAFFSVYYTYMKGI
jgi:hypothetical protein